MNSYTISPERSEPSQIDPHIDISIISSFLNKDYPSIYSFLSISVTVRSAAARIFIVTSSLLKLNILNFFLLWVNLNFLAFLTIQVY